MNPIGVVFYHRRWHVGLTDGRTIIDSRLQSGGVTERPLPPGYERIVWLEEDAGARAWELAKAAIGGPYTFCTAFVCACLESSCVLPGDVASAAASLKARERSATMGGYRRRVAGLRPRRELG